MKVDMSGYTKFCEEQIAKRKESNADLLPCPFCGSDDLVREIRAKPSDPLYNPGDNFIAIVKCLNCNAQIAGCKEQERYEELESGLYKKIPARTELEVVTEAWNRRNNTMTKNEKVIKGFIACFGSETCNCKGCPYDCENNGPRCSDELTTDIMELMQKEDVTRYDEA